MRLACLEAPVEIVRDRHGVPHVRARGLADLARAVGFVQARDRLFQMEMLRRFTFGRLSEVVGPAGLPVDRVVRRLRLGWSARQDAAAAGEEARAWAEAYCEGVNAFLARGPLPFELRLLRIRPEPWTPVDVHAPSNAMALGLAVNWQNELARMRMHRKLEPELLDELPPIVAASNSWALAGSRTASGKPLLANDPHLLLDLPSIWYPQHLEWEGGSIAGFSIAGAGVVVLGRTAGVAWGFTAAGADTQDLYLERFREDGRYEADGEWVEPERLRETIRVRFRRPPVVEEVVVTRHGPVVGRAGEHALALRWSAHEPARTLDCFLALARARTVDEADRAFDSFGGPPQNVVLGDADGTIAYRLAGGPIPRRRPGQGLEPEPGWDSSREWDGWLAPHELPRLRDPDGGAIVTANNRVAGPDYPHFLGADDLSPYRARRIEQLLAEVDAATVDDCRRIQLDQRSLPGLELAAIARSLEPRDGRERRALELLGGWDGDLGASSAAGALYAVLMRHLQREVYGPLGAEPPAEESAWRAESQIGLGLFERLRPALLRALAARDDAFLGEGRSWDDVFGRALASALAELGDGLGNRRWGELHRFVLAHPLSRLPVLRWLSRGPFPMGGDADTVWQMSWLAARPYGPRLAGPSFRAVYDLGDPDGFWFALPGGVSGAPRSRHYADLLPGWLRGELVRLRTTAVEGLHETLTPI